MKKILIIPSWHSNARHETNGSFFYEQALLASKEYEILYVRITSSRKSAKKITNYFSGIIWNRVSCTYEIRGVEGLFSDIQVTIGHSPFCLNDSIATYRKEAKCVFEVLRKIDWRPDIIHCHSVVSAGAIGNNLSKMLDVPYIITEHQHMLIPYFANENWPYIKSIYNESLHVYAVSRFERHMLVMNGVATSSLIPGNLIDENRFNLVDWSRFGREINLISIGRYDYLKDFNTLLDAYEALPKISDRNYHLTIVCSGDISQLRDVIVERGLTKFENLTLLPAQSREEISKLLQRSNIFLSTSIAETFGVAVCEAMMTGLPVVCTNSGGVGDFVINGFNGITTDLCSPKQIVDALASIVENSDAYRSIDIREYIMARYGSAVFMKKLNQMYQANE